MAAAVASGRNLRAASADTLGMTTSGSSVVKGETLADTARTLEAMAPDMIENSWPRCMSFSSPPPPGTVAVSRWTQGIMRSPTS